MHVSRVLEDEECSKGNGIPGIGKGMNKGTEL